MQLHQSQDASTCGHLSIHQDDISYDSTIADLCDLEPGAGTHSTRDFSTFGPQVASATTLREVASLSLGSWLTDLALTSSGAQLQARCTTTSSLIVDAIACEGNLQIRLNRHYEAARLFRHEQRNLINAIQMNAELSKMIASKNNDQRIANVSEKILQECQRFEFDGSTTSVTCSPGAHRLSRPAVMDALQAELDQWIQPPDEAAILLGIPQDCPRQLVSFSHQICAHLISRSASQVGIAIDNSAGDQLTLEIAAPLAAGDALTRLFPIDKTYFTAVSHSPVCPSQLGSSTPAYHFIREDNRASLTFSIAAAA